MIDNRQYTQHIHETVDESFVGCATIVVQEKVSIFYVQLGRSNSTEDGSTMDDGGAGDDGSSEIKLKWGDLVLDE